MRDIVSTSTGDTGAAGMWTGARLKNLRFTRRMRGYDESEVDRTLAAVAVQVDRQAQQIEQYQAEISRLQNNDDVKQRAIELLNQAQEIADQLVDEAVQHTRELMLVGRSQLSELTHHTTPAANGARRSTPVADPVVEVSPDAAYVQMHAQVSATQLRAVVDALSEQIDRLTEIAGPSPRMIAR